MASAPRKRGRPRGEPTEALFVRIPAEQARRLDRAAFELRTPKQALVSELVDRYVDPDSAASLAALAPLISEVPLRAREPMRGFASAAEESDRRRVTVETLDPDALIVGHHSFRALPSALAPEVLDSEQAAEMLQLERDVVERLAADSELPGRRLAGEWRFSRAALIDWLSHPESADEAREDPSER